MPIIHLADRDESKAREEMESRGGSNLRLHRGNQADGADSMYLYDTHVGLCLQEREMNGSWDSDFYMLVWNEEKGEPVEIMFATTRGWSYPCLGSAVDATPEVRAKYDAWKAKKDAERAQAAAEREAATPRKGKLVRVTRTTRGPQGRPVGTEGSVFWTGEGRSRGVSRLGVDAGGDRFFINSDAVEVVQ